MHADSGPDWAAAVTSVEYMVFHASSAPRTIMPLRNPFDVEDVAWPEMSIILGDYLTDAGR